MNKEKLLYEERIIQLEAELEKAIHTKEQYKKEQEEFIHLASHDLQAPLRKLSTFIERLTYKFKDITGVEAKSYIERIQLTLAGMENMINNLSALSDIAKSAPVFQKCDLNEVLRDALNEFQPAISVNKQIVTCSSLPVIEGNYDLLKNLFKTLIHNSIKFYKKNTAVEINIDSQLVKGDENNTLGLPGGHVYYKIEIMDNGMGFDERYAEKIFEPFQRLHGKSDYPGNGLGLAICKKIIEKHQGIIFAKSAKDSGSRFTLILPQAHN